MFSFPWPMWDAGNWFVSNSHPEFTPCMTRLQGQQLAISSSPSSIWTRGLSAASSLKGSFC